MLEARGITYAYPGARTPLYRDFDLAVGPDERVALSAPSGFGKTTLCRMLAGYDRPQKGEILVDGAPLPKRGTCPVQLILQHPETAVDPRMRMSQTLAEAGEVPQRLLDDLGIQKRWLARFQAQIWRFLVEETQARGIGLVFVSHSHALTERIATRVVDLAMR